MEDLFYQFVKKLEGMSETDHQTVYIDGTKLESAAGRYTFVPPSNQRERPTWEIIRAAPGKAATGDFSARFQPLFPHFFERADW